MTLLVLQELEGYYNQLSSGGDEHDMFGGACEKAFSGVELSNGGNQVEKIMKCPKGTAKVDTHSSSPVMSGDMASLRGAMGSWKPPPQKARGFSSKGRKSCQPPPNVTAVAPWAIGGQSSTNGRKVSGQKQPPLTVTGVAPWAVKKQTSGVPSPQSTRKASISNALPRPSKTV